VLQVIPQFVPSHVAVPFVELQAVHDAPHVDGLELEAQLPEQTWYAALQVKPHVPAVHTSAAFAGGAGQLVQLAPQCVMSEAR
jgi:hypothetical protein